MGGRRDRDRPAPPDPARDDSPPAFGLPDDDAVVVRASTALYLPWVISVCAALVCAVLAAVLPEPHGTSSFLVLAPLIPVLAVAAAYDTTDPLREVVGPTPLSKLRIALLRASVALAAAVPVTLGLGLLVPGFGGLAFAWLLPPSPSRWRRCCC